jgi:hypothetical protein
LVTLVAGLFVVVFQVSRHETRRAREWTHRWTEFGADSDEWVARFGKGDWRYLVGNGLVADDWSDRWIRARAGQVPRRIADWFDERGHRNRLAALAAAWERQSVPFDEARRELLLREASRAGTAGRGMLVGMAFMDGAGISTTNAVSALATLVATGDPEARRAVAEILQTHAVTVPGGEAGAWALMQSLSRDADPMTAQCASTAMFFAHFVRPLGWSNPVPTAVSK